MKTTEENNRMIAEFMGVIPSIGIYKLPFTQWKWMSSVLNGEGIDSTNEFTIDELQYHTSWDWLMPVVEKINSELKGVMNVLIMSNACRIYADDNSFNHSEEQDSTIQATYQAVVQFIEWYNKQK